MEWTGKHTQTAVTIVDNVSVYLEFSSIHKYVLGLQVDVLAVFKDQTILNQNEVQKKSVSKKTVCPRQVGDYHAVVHTWTVQFQQGMNRICVTLVVCISCNMEDEDRYTHSHCTHMYILF